MGIFDRFTRKEHKNQVGGLASSESGQVGKAFMWAFLEIPPPIPEAALGSALEKVTPEIHPLFQPWLRVLALWYCRERFRVRFGNEFVAGIDAGADSKAEEIAPFVELSPSASRILSVAFQKFDFAISERSRRGEVPIPVEIIAAIFFLGYDAMSPFKGSPETGGQTEEVAIAFGTLGPYLDAYTDWMMAKFDLWEAEPGTEFWRMLSRPLG